MLEDRWKDGSAKRDLGLILEVDIDAMVATIRQTQKKFDECTLFTFATVSLIIHNILGNQVSFLYLKTGNDSDV